MNRMTQYSSILSVKPQVSNVSNQDNVDINWKSIDDVYVNISNYYESKQEKHELKYGNSGKKLKNKTKNKNKNKNKKDKRERTMYLFDDLHKDLKDYWSPYGFMNKSSANAFASSMLQSIKVSRYIDNNIVYEQKDKNEEE